MPEIKNAFIQGKMNKDLDERLIPNGEYRDAVNVDVDFSEGSDVGALKSILGNTQRDTISLSNAKCIGTAKDIENNKIYWFITSSAKDLIAEWDYASNTYDTIIVDSGSVLNFNTANFITGANVIDGILFFTDNLNEPRQVDIEYWRGQTSGSAGTSTGLSAERINVIKKSPQAAPGLTMSSSTRGGAGTAGGNTVTCSINLAASSGSDLQNAKDAGTTVSGTFSADPNYQANDVIVFSFDFIAGSGDITKTEARIKMASNYGGGASFTGAEILTISKQVRGAAVAYTCLLQEDDPLFELKFPRFSYRYKYNNGQYSCLAPFSNPAFLPDSTVGGGSGFEYNAEDGYNKAMVNTLRSLTLTNLNSNIHGDVDEIDIIYKESVGTNVYIVDTVKRQSNNSIASTFEVKDEQIFKVLPSNQLLRLFDSVPKKAKSQNITANRLIYGNYTHQFDLPVTPITFDIGLRNRYDPTDSNRNERQSMKSNRTYQIGVAYMDQYGRQTPVLTDKTGIIKIPQGQAKNMTQLMAKITSSAPSFATNYRYFIKEISSIQYNLCADSFYQDDQGYVYVSFPSAEINKVSVDDILILKKKTGNDPSEITDKFKVLDKLTTPPKFLAKPLKEYYSPTTFTFSRDFEQDHDQLTIKPGSTPVPDKNRVTIRDFHNKGENKVASTAAIGGSDRGVSKDAYTAVSIGKKVRFVCGDTQSKVYEVKSRELNLDGNDDIELHFTEEFGNDVIGLYEDYINNPTTTALRPGVQLIGVEEKDESGKAEFEGRFFLKLKADTNLIAEFKGSTTNTENLNAISTISLDGDQSDNDPRALHVFCGGNAGENTSSSSVRTAAPTAGGWTSPNNNASSTTFPGWQNGVHGSVLVNDPYHFAIRTDKSYGDSDSSYGSHPFLQNLKVGNFLKFDNGPTADSNYYKIERVFSYNENYDGSTRKVYGIGLDTNLTQRLRRQGEDGDTNVMQITVYEIDSDDLVNITNPPIFETEPQDDVDIDLYYETQENMTIADNHGNKNLLSYYNCISFENGVEGVTIRDDFNAPPVGKGVRVSTIFEDNYQEESIPNGLIFSQIYNGKTNVNRLNQFIIAENITKQLNPDYGSIQLLHTRYNDIIAYCENKVIKILTNKDALFNADGNVNVTSNKAVLGQAMPYNSNYGISTNPESFAFYTHRAYFTDRKKGVVVRHSMDGMEAISDYGMKDFFRNALPANTGNMVGSYDIRKHQYNISTHPTNANSTVSFSESINGWTSKKSFIPEAAESIQNKYFTFKNGHIFEHHVGSVCNFYGSKVTPYVDVILNESPANMKNFRTLNYEGDSGWACLSVVTDQQDGAVDSFVNKENKYFNYIRGKAETASTIDLKALNVQGIGVYNTVTNNSGNTVTYSFTNNVPQDLQKGDTLYFVHPTGSVVTAVGAVTVVTDTSVTASYSTVPPISGSFSKYFVFYAKNARWETSGLLGYYATVKMQNTANTVKEIYAVGSEISISS